MTLLLSLPHGWMTARRWLPSLRTLGAAAIGLGLFLTISAGDASAADDPRLPVTPVSERPAVPDLSWTDAGGAVHHLSDLRGQVVVLNFWATWCAPCVREMPSLDTLKAKVSDVPVTVIALSQDRGGVEQVSRFFEDTGIRHLEMLFDPKMAAGRLLKLKGLPTTLIIDRQGREVARHAGYEAWDDPAIEGALRGLAREGDGTADPAPPPGSDADQT